MSPMRFVISSLLFALSTATAVAQVAPVAHPTITASDSNYVRDFRYQVQFADYLQLRRDRPTDIVFIGDSITEQFRWGPGNTTWKRLYEQRALNFGKGGDRTRHVLWRLDHQPLDGVAPKVAVLMIGTNNQQDAPAEIVAGIRAIIAKVQAKWPSTQILLLSILPNGRQTERMAETNKLLPALAEAGRVTYLDVAPLFAPQGDNWKGLQGDKLHLTAQGYEMLVGELDPAIAKLMK